MAMGSVEMPDGFADFDAGHRDLVSVTKFNFYGNRIVTASSDHRMKVWDQKEGQWQLTDTWRAHDAEIRDVRPGSPTMSRRPLIHTPGNMEWAVYRSTYW